MAATEEGTRLLSPSEVAWRLHLTQRAHRWDITGRESSMLLKGEELACCRDLGARSKPGILETAYLNESLAAGGASRGLLLNRMVAALVDLIAVAALAVGLWFAAFSSVEIQAIAIRPLLAGLAAFVLCAGLSLLLGGSPGLWLSRLRPEPAAPLGLIDRLQQIPLLVAFRRQGLTADGWRARHRPLIANFLCLFHATMIVFLFSVTSFLWSFGDHTISDDLFPERTAWDGAQAGLLMGLLGLTEEDMRSGVYISSYDMGGITAPFLIQIIIYAVLLYMLLRMKWRTFLQTYFIFFGFFVLSMIVETRDLLEQGLLTEDQFHLGWIQLVGWHLFAAIIFVLSHSTMSKWGDQRSKHMLMTLRYFERKLASA